MDEKLEIQNRWDIKGWGERFFVLGRAFDEISVHVIAEVRAFPKDISVENVLRKTRAVREIRIFYNAKLPRHRLKELIEKIMDIVNKYTKMFVVTVIDAGIITIYASITKWVRAEALIDQIANLKWR